MVESAHESFVVRFSDLRNCVAEWSWLNDNTLPITTWESRFEAAATALHLSNPERALEIGREIVDAAENMTGVHPVGHRMMISDAKGFLDELLNHTR